MKNFKQKFWRHLDKWPDSRAITNNERSISYRDLADEIILIRNFLSKNHIDRLAIALTNSPAYICLDLSAVFLQIISIAIPHFFTSEQIDHLLYDAAVDAVIVDREFKPGWDFYNKTIKSIDKIDIFGKTHWLLKFEPPCEQKILPAETVKISYTSGTTGQAKGVVICGPDVDKVIDSLSSRLNARSEDRHISVLPYSLLLENIAGIYTVLAAGGMCIVPAFDELGFSGSSSLDIARFLKTIVQYQPTTMITVPAIAKTFVTAAERSNLKFESFRFIAVGGAPLSGSVIEKAHQSGLPLHQGYGLTEACSVVSINTQSEIKPGSVGRPLDHADISISEDGEILVSGSLCAGYIGKDINHVHNIWKTGDLGYLDEDGFLYITGRKRTSFCTAYGRNISPEWVESELCAQPEILQAVIYGEGKRFNIAIVFTLNTTSDEKLDTAILNANKRLPDYAKIRHWIKADEPYSVSNRQLSHSGIAQRAQVYDDYKNEIDSIYH